MKKKILFLASACVLGTFASFVSLNSTKASAPLCDFVRCPGGSQSCCTEDGVTLYNKAKSE